MELSKNLLQKPLKHPLVNLSQKQKGKLQSVGAKKIKRFRIKTHCVPGIMMLVTSQYVGQMLGDAEEGQVAPNQSSIESL